MTKRKHLSEATVETVLVACRRRCCLCYFLKGNQEERRGQIAHLNKRSDDDRLENLVWLCLEHHDSFDGNTSQSKGYTLGEVRHWRDKLIETLSEAVLPAGQPMARIAREVVAEAETDPAHRWRFPLWLIANRPEFFAYSAPGADGICTIERIDLPDGRIVIACVEMPGNPGKSITNAAEYIFRQVCERFELSTTRVVWLENYEFFDRDEWRQVTFGVDGSAEPEWTTMTPDMWRGLLLSPKRRVTASSAGELRSKVRKHFPWPPVEMALGLDS
ncbi:hypothetical protein GO308_00115 [Sphingomonas sp. SFZ2018-12]|uniref:hypothetical protein n=1 Tax=unclassified Sphingomonas TaxID=196159 RepID=UPI001F0E6E2F|nr:hypothetical protein [Sphingomonas sp. SFZ2018-12]MBX9815426.1 hypothetical protein [Sphingomonas sp.]MCH4891509.1 hypothetical protein [Sphingomonas sp. SFZ2018-12]